MNPRRIYKASVYQLWLDWAGLLHLRRGGFFRVAIYKWGQFTRTKEPFRASLNLSHFARRVEGPWQKTD